MMSKRRITWAVMAIVVIAGVATTFAQRVPQRRESSASSQSYSGNVRYDGRFVFVRMSYPAGGGFGSRGGQPPPWAHDWPIGETHFLKLLTSLTNMSSHTDASSIMSFSDPEMFKFPILYLVEPGYWGMSDTDVTTLRDYLLKGGFLIVDDFPNQQGRGWANFDLQMSRVFPEGKWIQLDATHSMFHSFYELDDIDNIPTAYSLGGRPEFWALFEDNDPTKRMYAIANFQNDLSEFWEFSETGRYMIQDSNQAYKFGINEFIYGITH